MLPRLAGPPRAIRRRVVLATAACAFFVVVGFVIGSDVLGDNEHVVATKRLYRSAQLSTHELDRVIAANHILCVVGLRKNDPPAPEFAAEITHLDAIGIEHETIPLSPTRLPKPEAIAALIARYDAGPYPMLVHCEKGADRTGLASVVWSTLFDGKSLAEARASELSLKTGHLAWGQAHALDDFFDLYERTSSGLSLRRWMLEEYPTLYDGRARATGPGEVLAHDPG